MDQRRKNTLLGSWGWPQAGLALVWLVVAGPVWAQALSEDDYFADVPEVLTVTRLSQPLSDTPGAVTVIHRDTIRLSGARDLVDVLRWVPGFLVSGYNGANTSVAYHAPMDEFGIRNLVLVDGRSVYSSYLVGDTHRGLLTVPLEDIERIEVLRGSNSAAYGANALFGVINIVTRHAADTLGQGLTLKSGHQGVRDLHARVGWGDADAAFRLSVQQLADEGFVNRADNRRLRQWQWRADGQVSASTEWLVKLGGSVLDGIEDNPSRATQWQEHHIQGLWQHARSPTEQFRVMADLSVEDIDDTVYTGTGQRLNMEFQHHLVLHPQWRGVWGLGLKQEEAKSLTLYQRSGFSASMRESRWFGHLEWRPSNRWTLNAGLLWGQHSHIGGYAAPRLMLNHHLWPGHTLRVGVGRSYRAPGLLELEGYAPPIFEASGKVRPEALFSQEVSYLGQWPAQRLQVDARLYRERLSDWIDRTEVRPYDYENRRGFVLRGLEYQLQWSPQHGTRVTWQQNFSQLEWADPLRADWHQPPARSSALVRMQGLPGALDLSLLWYGQSAMTWRRIDSQLPASQRVDLRLAHQLRVGRSAAELAWTVQDLRGQQVIGLPGNRQGRRYFLALSLEH